jgi:hypothetical protein
LSRSLDIGDGCRSPPERRLQHLFPPRVAEISGQIDKGLKAVSAADAFYHHHPLRGQLPTPGARAPAVAQRMHRDLGTSELDRIEPQKDGCQMSAGRAARQENSSTSTVKLGWLLGASA